MVIGGGLVGVELFGELTAFANGIANLYKHVNRDEVRFILLEAGSRIMPEIDPTLADYGTDVLRKRRGADVRTGASVQGKMPTWRRRLRIVSGRPCHAPIGLRRAYASSTAGYWKSHRAPTSAGFSLQAAN